MFEQLIERQNDGHRLTGRFCYRVCAKISIGAPHQEICISDAGRKQDLCCDSKIRFGEFGWERFQRHHTGQRRRRPNRWLRAGIEQTSLEIAPPSEARRRLLDQRLIRGGVQGGRVACAPDENQGFG